MKHFIPLFTLLISVGVLSLLSSCSAKKAENQGQNQSSGPRAIQVDAYIPQYESLEQVVNATGSLLPNESVLIRPERSGKITGIHFTEGSFVKKGALLFTLDTEELTAQKEKLAVQREYFESELKRAGELQQIQAITEEEYDRIQNQLNQVKADLALNQVYLSKTRITAPFSGTMGLRQVSNGAYVSPADVLVAIDQSHPVKLEFEVPERYLQDVKPEQTLSFTISGLDRSFEATVYAISNQISSETRSFTVRGRSENPDGILKPGAFARIELITRVNDEAILIPTDAIIPVLNGQQVFLLREGKALARPVETGVRKGERIEVVEGIEAGDTLLVSGLLSLSDGLPVQARSIDSSGTNVK